MKHFIVAGLYIMGCAALCLLSGCKAGEAKRSGFTDSEKMANDPSLPFHKVWREPGIDWTQYSKIYVAEVDTSYLMNTTDWNKGFRREDFEKDIKEISVFTRDTVNKAFKEDPNHRYEVADQPSRSRDTIILEIAITELVPSKVALNALGWAPFGFGVKAVRAAADDRSKVAFEARVRDAATQKVIAAAADREAEQAAPVTTKAFKWYSHAKSIIETWAAQFVQVANRKPGEQVKDTEAFTLKAW